MHMSYLFYVELLAFYSGVDSLNPLQAQAFWKVNAHIT